MFFFRPTLVSLLTLPRSISFYPRTLKFSKFLGMAIEGETDEVVRKKRMFQVICPS